MVAQYADWISPGERLDEEHILPDSGAVLRRGLKKVALYRDAQGRMHQFSAVCPHLGCIVRWNPTEKTWDCPCHGSRFTRQGEVITGPSNDDLRKLE